MNENKDSYGSRSRESLRLTLTLGTLTCASSGVPRPHRSTGARSGGVAARRNEPAPLPPADVGVRTTEMRGGESGFGGESGGGGPTEPRGVKAKRW